MRDLSLENPIRAIREIRHDVTCRKKVRLANGRELSAIEVQEIGRASCRERVL